MTSQTAERGPRSGLPASIRISLPFLGLAIVSIGLPIFVAHHYGALGIPRSDDWSYLQTLFRLADHGTLDGNHWVSMTLIGQLGVTLPVVWIFDHDIAATQVAVAIMGFGGLVATYWCGAGVLGARRAALIVATIALGPLWGPLAASYMTDVPAFAATMVALALAVAALRRSPVSISCLAGALATAVLAFSIRQYAFVALVAIAVVAIRSVADQRDRARLRMVATLSVAAVVVCGGVFAWWSQIPNLKTYVPAIPDGHSLSVTVIKGGGFLRLIGLLLAPVVVVAGPVRILRRSWLVSRRATVLAGAGTLVALGALSARVPAHQFVGNYIESNGTLGSDAVLGRRPGIFPSPVFGALVLIGTLSGAVIVVAGIPLGARLAARVRRRDFRVTDPATFCLGLAATGYVSVYGAAMVTGVSVYDRYMLPLLPLIAIGLLRPGRVDHPSPPPVRWLTTPMARRVIQGASLVMLGVVGLTFTVDSASFDGTSWKTAAAASRRGYSRHQINGGFAWVNFYRGLRPPRLVVGTHDGQTAPTHGFGSYCVLVSVGPPADGREVLVTRRYRSLARSDAKIVAVRDRCPPRGSR